jgi:hypothetical protein
VATGTPGSLGVRTGLTGEISFSIPKGVELRQLPVGIGAPGADESCRVRVRSDDPVSALFSLTRWALEHDHQRGSGVAWGDLAILAAWGWADWRSRSPAFRWMPAAINP